MPLTFNVRCLDNPARSPYEAHNTMDIQTAPQELGYRVYELGVVPAGMRLVIEYLSAVMFVGAAVGSADLAKAAARLSHEHAMNGEPSFGLDIPFTHLQGLSSGSNALLLSQAITLYVPSASKVRLLVTPHPNARAVEVFATGHYVRL